MTRASKQNYYEVLDVSLNANPDIIRTAYIRAKNAYNRDSLAAYSLFDPEESKQIINEIEEAYDVLSDSEKRRKYDESHGILSSDGSYDSPSISSPAAPKNNSPTPTIAAAPTSTSTQAPAANHGNLSPIERLKSAQSGSAPLTLRTSYQVSKNHTADPEIEEKILAAANVNGAFLKMVREYKQVRPEEIIDILKISKNYLNALETDDFSKLPATVFVRGFVIQYAKALKLDHEKVAASYMVFLKTQRPS